MSNQDGFRYRQGRSTTGIFYEVIGIPCVVRWQPAEIDHPIFPLGLDTLPICSSCNGLNASRLNAYSGYFVGNPFVKIQEDEEEEEDEEDIRYDQLPLHPSHHPPGDTHAVLVVDDVPETEAPSPVYYLLCAFRKAGNVYNVNVFRSNWYDWGSHEEEIDLRDGCIVPNSGVSCSRIACWLVSASPPAPTSVLMLEVVGLDYDAEIRSSVLRLPPGAPRRRARMQLGRVGALLGLVIVDEARSTVELYTLRYDSHWALFDSFKVELEADANGNGDGWVASWGQEEKAITCREMPRPIRFESSKVELLFWVQGRVVILENSEKDPHTYRMTVCPQCVPAAITDGLPHLCTDLVPRRFIQWWW